MRALLVLFIVIPIVEMWLLIQIGGQIGAIPTILLVFITAAAGLALLREQGLKTLLKLNQRIQHGQLPALEILEGVALAVGGALLLTPGFITDAVGFICLVPLTRKFAIAALVKQGFGFASANTFRHEEDSNARQNAKEGNSSRTTLDGEFRRED
ncbi:MAG: FxsA family protein [Spongiibacteraceae bacterium]|nr:FxsA family protein [Spongiibacteraceae bacterium]